MPRSRSLAEEIRTSPGMRAALAQLEEARRGAELLHLDRWQTAIEGFGLLNCGCTPTQLRLLAAAGFIDHAEETTGARDSGRSFRAEHVRTFGLRSCFVLTEAGSAFLLGKSIEAATRFEGDSEDPTTGFSAGNILRLDGSHPRVPIVSGLVPCWNPATRELHVGDRLVKRFRRPAPVLQLVLASFQELDWPPHLDDPLPPRSETVPEDRLRDTVRRLNRCQDPFLIRFESDGRGAGIRWGWVEKKTGENPRMNHGRRLRISK